jgi:hypothetical protein
MKGEEPEEAESEGEPEEEEVKSEKKPIRRWSRKGEWKYGI